MQIVLLAPDEQEEEADLAGGEGADFTFRIQAQEYLDSNYDSVNRLLLRFEQLGSSNEIQFGTNKKVCILRSKPLASIRITE